MPPTAAGGAQRVLPMLASLGRAFLGAPRPMLIALAIGGWAADSGETHGRCGVWALETPTAAVGYGLWREADVRHRWGLRAHERPTAPSRRAHERPTAAVGYGLTRGRRRRRDGPTRGRRPPLSANVRVRARRGFGRRSRAIASSTDERVPKWPMYSTVSSRSEGGCRSRIRLRSAVRQARFTRRASAPHRDG
jgi:hypothetical protein